ncbi:MAG: hypothetical protein WCQ60_02330 [bacterium]
MSPKALIWIGMTVGSTVGAYLPALWGGSLLGFASIFLSAAGGFAGIFAGFKLKDYF